MLLFVQPVCDAYRLLNKHFVYFIGIGIQVFIVCLTKNNTLNKIEKNIFISRQNLLCLKKNIGRKLSKKSH